MSSSMRKPSPPDKDAGEFDLFCAENMFAMLENSLETYVSDRTKAEEKQRQEQDLEQKKQEQERVLQLDRDAAAFARGIATSAKRFKSLHVEVGMGTQASASFSGVLSPSQRRALTPSPSPRPLPSPLPLTSPSSSPSPSVATTPSPKVILKMHSGKEFHTTDEEYKSAADKVRFKTRSPQFPEGVLTQEAVKRLIVFQRASQLQFKRKATEKELKQTPPSSSSPIKNAPQS